MGTVIPLGYSNVRYLFQCQGITDPTGFSVGDGLLGGLTAAEIPNAAQLALRTSGIGAAANMLAGWTFVGCVSTTMTSSGPVVHSFFDDEVGTIAQNGVPPNCAMLVNKQTALGGRKNRGRIFFPPITFLASSVDDAGFVATAQVSNFQTKLNLWHTEMTNLNLVPVLLHSSPADEPTPISSFLLQTQLATQRRRMR